MLLLLLAAAGVLLALQPGPGRGRGRGRGRGPTQWFSSICWSLVDILLEQPIVLEGVSRVSGRMVIASCLSLALLMNSMVKSQVLDLCNCVQAILSEVELLLQQLRRRLTTRTVDSFGRRWWPTCPSPCNLRVFPASMN